VPCLQSSRLKLSVCAAVCVAIMASAPTADAAEPRFGAFIDPFPGYEGQSKCDPSPKPGVLAFQSIVLAKEPGTGAGSISRDCSIGGQSEHKEGRAWDWGARADVPSQRAAAERILDWLAAPDSYGNEAALARRFGIMYLIFNRRIWSPGGGWRVYCVQKGKGCVAPGTKSDVRDPHTSHVHFSFTWDGALKKTSYWHPKDSFAAALAAAPAGGYWAAGRGGGIVTGGTTYLGSADDGAALNHPVAAMASTPSGRGYWLTTTRGHVLAFGDASFRGQVRHKKTRIVDFAPTPSGRGYWLVSSGGRVMPFGDADRYGGLGGDQASPSPVVALLPKETGPGYTLVTSDGAVHGFGDAAAAASSTSLKSEVEVVAATASPLGGAWLTTAGGRVVATGSAPSLPDLSRKKLGFPVIDIAPTVSGRGYYLLLENGRVVAFGDAR
jgi:hypothetical protein